MRRPEGIGVYAVAGKLHAAVLDVRAAVRELVGSRNAFQIIDEDHFTSL